MSGMPKRILVVGYLVWFVWLSAGVHQMHTCNHRHDHGPTLAHEIPPSHRPSPGPSLAAFASDRFHEECPTCHYLATGKTRILFLVDASPCIVLPGLASPNAPESYCPPLWLAPGNPRGPPAGCRYPLPHVKI